jgi:hypothetical protein
VFRSRLPKRGYYNSILAWVGRAAYTEDVVLNEEAMSTYPKWPALLLNSSHLTCSTVRSLCITRGMPCAKPRLALRHWHPNTRPWLPILHLTVICR